ncbi:MAG TPA: hypothetical protein VEP90_10950, partial [Methylomirabilota bacterium]|nr:hypothetical protein [Methylomirabilota bacterium]
MKFSTELIVTILRIAYERTCPLLTIKKPFIKDDIPRELTKFVKQFWSSRNRNKIMAQSLITSDELLVKIRKIFPEISFEVITYTITTLIDIGALWLIDVDTNGSNIKKILLTPLGLELWRRIDEGILFNQQQVSHQYIKQIFNQDLLL